MSGEFVTDSNVLIVLSAIGIISSVAAAWYALAPLQRANGSRPILQGLIGIASVEFAWAGMMAYNALFHEDILPDGGAPLFISLFARMKPTIIAGGLIFMGFRIRRGMDHGGQ